MAKTTPEEVKKWVEEFKGGKTIYSIAKATGRAYLVVARAIRKETAKKETTQEQQ